VLKPEQLLAVHHIYEGRDVFLLLPTTFGKSICYEVLLFLLDCKLGKSESIIVIIVSPLVSLIVDQVASLRSHGLKIWLGKPQRMLYSSPIRVGHSWLKPVVASKAVECFVSTAERQIHFITVPEEQSVFLVSIIHIQFHVSE